MNTIVPVAKEVIFLTVLLSMFVSLLFIIWSMCENKFKNIGSFFKPKECNDPHSSTLDENKIMFFVLDPPKDLDKKICKSIYSCYELYSKINNTKYKDSNILHNYKPKNTFLATMNYIKELCKIYDVEAMNEHKNQIIDILNNLQNFLEYELEQYSQELKNKHIENNQEIYKALENLNKDIETVKNFEKL